MTRTGKIIRREVVYVRSWGGFTNRGHPNNYTVILACGHVYTTSYGHDVVLMQFALSHGLIPKHKCYGCIRHEPISLKSLEETPQSIWKEQNFDRFLTRKPIKVIESSGIKFVYVPSDDMIEQEKQAKTPNK